MAEMNAAVVHEFGGPQVLRYERVPRPEPGPGEVLVRVHAAGLNPPDLYRRAGYTNFPEAVRPRPPALPFLPGSDVSGTVAATGPGADRFRKGDAVFGLLRFPSSSGPGGRGYAEYVTAPEEEVAAKPRSVDHARAAAIPMAGLTALQFLDRHVRPKPGERVLVNGAAGGVGHFLVQLARLRGAHVVAVASGGHADFLAELGADEHVDYTRTDVGAEVRGVDHVVDSVGGPAAHRLLATLRPGGTLLPVFYGDYRPAEAAALGVTLLDHAQVRSDAAGVAELAALVDRGLLTVGIDSVHPLTDAARAHARAERGHVRGKIVLVA